MKVKLHPAPFFLGLALGLGCLSWIGSTVESPNLIRNFVRFHQLISVESGYFPTARQVRSVVDRPADPEAKVHVIVGGSSVLHGVGQHESLIWTRFLQDRLGREFQVTNLAQRAGTSADFGNIAAELLLLQSRPVIFIADANVTTYVASLETSFYRHIIFDAWQRGYLLPWKPRDKLLSEAMLDGSGKLRAPALGALLNRYLNFNDLWNFVAFEYANTSWNWLLANKSFAPRKTLRDLDLTPEQYERHLYAHDMDAAMRIVRGQVGTEGDPRWKQRAELINQLVPPDLRAVTLATVHIESPYYRDRLSPSEQAAYLAQAQYQAEQMRKLGFNRAIVAADAFLAEDYIDRVHLSVSGGSKLAATLAPAVRAMAIEQGYLK